MEEKIDVQIEEKPKKKVKLDKKTLSIVSVIVLGIILVAGAYFMFAGNNSSNSDDLDGSPSIDSDLPELSPEDVGMEVTVREDGRAVMFELTKADDIEYVEYIIEYEAETEEGGITNQGIFGEMNIGEDGITETDFREFGTCSAGRCRYDNVVSDVTINLTKVEKKDGNVYRVTKVVELESSE